MFLLLQAVLLVLCSVVVALTDGRDHDSGRQPFTCLGVHVCNRDTWQYCDVDVYKRCRHCSDVEHQCWSQDMPLNCSKYCLEQKMENERVKSCPPMEAPQHGSHNGTDNGTEHGTAVVLECETGYQPFGPTTIVCQDFGHYSGTFICQAVEHVRTFLLGFIVASIVAGFELLVVFGLCFYIWRQKQTDEKKNPDETPLVSTYESSNAETKLFIEEHKSATGSQRMKTGTGESASVNQNNDLKPTAMYRQHSRSDPRDLKRYDESSREDPVNASIPDLSPRGASGGPPLQPPTQRTGVSTDSGIDMPTNTASRSQTFNININNFVNTNANAEANSEANANAHNSVDIKEASASSTSAMKDKPTASPTAKVPDKYSTEESSTDKKSCRAEIDDDRDTSDAGYDEEVNTERKGAFDNRTGDSSSDDLMIVAQEQEKNNRQPNLVSQDFSGDEKKAKFAIGGHDLHQSQVLKDSVV